MHLREEGVAVLALELRLGFLLFLARAAIF